jgi:hypothetical protein
MLIGWTFSNLNFTFSPPPIQTQTLTPPSTILLAESSRPEVHPDLHRTERLLNTSRPIEALAILSGISPTIDLYSTEGKKWLRLLVDAYAALDNQDQLILIYNQFPDALEGNEHATLAIADRLIEEQNTSEYNQLRTQWQGKEKELTRWVFLDTQAKIIGGDKNAAAALLEANYFRGKEETDRLIRLAALYLVEDPKRSWKYLAEASENDPRNPDILTFKASLSEVLNNTNVANSDYITAVQYDPESPFRREQLADFYLRTKQYKQALEILQDTMSAPSLDSIWLKSLFWSHLTIPLKHSWRKQDIPQGNLRDLASYILTLPAGIYWDEKAFNTLPEYQSYLANRQETFWLQLLSALKTGQEEKALKLLNDNIFQYTSWAPDLEKGLKKLIRYKLLQKTDNNTALATIFQNESKSETPKQLLQALANLSDTSTEQLSSAIPAPMQDLLLSEEAYTLLFLAVDWTEAAIQLHKMEKLPGTFPSWVAESITNAINQNRNGKAALAFALNQKSTPSLSLLIAELALDNDEPQVAFNSLKGIYTENNDSGRRAALLLGQFLLEHNNLMDAKKALLVHPSLANDVAAREILARIALQEGNYKKAFHLYLELEKDSSEAKSFLARKAFTDKEWGRARELTEALLKEYPKNTLLNDNLQKIIAEEKKRKNPIH